MSTDRKYTPGGTEQTAGNYEDDNTIASRAGRLYMLEEGNWPAARGRTDGSRLHTLEKDDGTAHAEAERMIVEAWEPLTESGEMGAIEVTPEFIAGRDDVLGNTVVWTDNTQSDSLGHERAAGRQG